GRNARYAVGRPRVTPIYASSTPAYGKGAPRRVVITGHGVVSSLGHTSDEFYGNLLAGKSGISMIESFDASDFSTQIAGEIKDFSAEGYVLKKWVKRQVRGGSLSVSTCWSGVPRCAGRFYLLHGTWRRRRRQNFAALPTPPLLGRKRPTGVVVAGKTNGSLLPSVRSVILRDPCTTRILTLARALPISTMQDKVMLYLQTAGKKALDAAGINWREEGDLNGLDRAKCGVLIGTAMGGLNTFSTAAEALTTSGHRKMNPFCIPFAIGNMGGAMLAIDLGFMGPNYSISTACATGNYCILQAAEHIRRGDADLMLAGGADAAVIPSGIGGFIACKALSKRNDDPQAASRPWDKNRDGFVMGEGAGVVTLEEYEHAKARGAPILAEFIGGAFTCDAHHISEPQPEGRGVISCIKQSLENAGVAAEDVDYVNAHGTSTPAGDMAEYRAITTAIPHKGLKINSTKSLIGHLLGGAGAVEAVAVIEALRRDELHPNLNLDDPEDDVDLDVLVGKAAEKHRVNIALSNSFGFGGHNSSILFKKFEA
ncbi:MAG: beta-ketoacyl-ACP synthase II, partial [bacterium]